MTLPTRRKIFSLAGEGQTNPDGRKRQDVLLDVHPGDPVQLVREPENGFDGNAIRVDVEDGTIGYLSRDDAILLAPSIDSGRAYRAIVHCLRGGVPGYPSYGCQISVAWDDQPDHHFIDLDHEQESSRKLKLMVRDRGRTGRGRFNGGSEGCLGALVLIFAVSAVSINFG